MKTIAALAAAATLLAGAGAAFASGLLGPPEPEARGDELSLSAAYQRDATEWKAGGGGFESVSLSRNQAYLQILDPGISFAERAAGFLRVGRADFDDGADFQDGFKPFGSVGIKDVWYGRRKTTLTVGTIFLASFYPGYEAEKTLLNGEVVKAKIKNQWDVALGVAVEKHLDNKLRIYGGPLLVYGRAKVTRQGAGFDDATTYEEKSPAGLFGGVALTISRRLVAIAEAQYRSDLSAGASIDWSFE